MEGDWEGLGNRGIGMDWVIEGLGEDWRGIGRDWVIEGLGWIG